MRRFPLTRVRRGLLVVGAAALCLTVPAPGPHGSAGAAPAPADSLGARWVRAMDALHVTGMTVVVVDRDGVIRNETLGLRDIERNLPVDADTEFYIASCTKAYVACAATLLAADGTLDLDTAVRRYLPRFTLADAAYADSITVRDLLCHRPGLVSSCLTWGEAYTGQMNDDRFYRVLAGVTPRRRFTYSNVHYYLVGRIIEAVTGRSWKDVLAERIFAPAGMNRTTCSATTLWADANAAQPFVFEDGRFVVAQPVKIDATMHAAGGIATSSRDLARWLRVQLGDGMLDGRRVLDAGALRAMREPIATDAADRHPLIKTEQRIAWSAGWDVRTFRGDTLYCHNGTFAGAGAFVSFLPARNVGVAVVANSGGMSVYLAEVLAAEAYDAVLGESNDDLLPQLAAIAEKKAHSEAEPAANGHLTRAAGVYAGTFVNDDWGTLTLTAHGDSLDARVGALPLHVRLIGTDRIDAGGYAGSFETDASGGVVAVWLGVAEPDSARFVRR